MAILTNNAEREVLNTLFTASGIYTAGYFALYTGTVNEEGAGTEVSGGGYARVAIPTNFFAASSAATDGGGKTTIASALELEFPVATSAWTAATTLVLIVGGNTVSGGTLKVLIPLASTVTLATSQQLKFAVGGVVIEAQ
jgi:hypothetical protein